MKIFNDITQTIGNTPLVRINVINQTSNTILAKLESFNPSHSLKDRIANNMLRKAMGEGKINQDTIIIESTSGNTGIGLAMCCAALGLKLIITMPDSMSLERRKLLKAYGAELVLTPSEFGMQGAVDKALELQNTHKNSFIPAQFENESNPRIHELTTAMEIWTDTEGRVDIVVAGIGTGGTITGVSRKLKQLKPSVRTIGVEPAESPLLTQGKANPHGIQGIGANFVPKILEIERVNEILTVSQNDAAETTRLLARKEGILCGISSGAAMKAALQTAQTCENKTIVVILADYGERYLSTELFE